MNHENAFELLQKYRRNLNILELQAADFSTSSIPIHIINQIEYTKKLIIELEKSLIDTKVDKLYIIPILEAMGYRVQDSYDLKNGFYFLCQVKWGAEKYIELIRYMEDIIDINDIAVFSDAIISKNAKRGILLTNKNYSSQIEELISERHFIKNYTIDQFINKLADFDEYLNSFISDFDEININNYYVPLEIEEKHNKNMKIKYNNIEDWMDGWVENISGNHISVLGEFGSGKTWFCLHYTYICAKRYLENPERHRIPILISLKEYSRAYNIEQLITDALINKYNISLPAGYKTFEQLNKNGKLLLIFDGFDEMERKVNEYKTTFENFWELSRVVTPRSKVILTCRTSYFRNQEEEDSTLYSDDKQINLIADNAIINLKINDGFSIVYIKDMSENHIIDIIKRRFHDEYESVYNELHKSANLAYIISRPILLELTLGLLSEIRDLSKINKGLLYESHINKLISLREDKDTDYISRDQRLFFIEEIAWEMYKTQRYIIPFSEFPDKATHLLKSTKNSEGIHFFERDLRYQSYLARDEFGNYQFIHKSFMEYFVARKICREIINNNYDILARVFTAEVRDFVIDIIHKYDIDFIVYSRNLMMKTNDRHMLWNMAEFCRGLPYKYEIAEALIWCLWYDIFHTLPVSAVGREHTRPLMLPARRALESYGSEVQPLIHTYIEKAKTQKRWAVREALKKIDRNIKKRLK